MSELAIGDTVRLKSGGPVMTIEKYGFNYEYLQHDRSRVFCSWFEGSEKRTEEFATEALKKAGPDRFEI